MRRETVFSSLDYQTSQLSARGRNLYSSWCLGGENDNWTLVKHIRVKQSKWRETRQKQEVEQEKDTQGKKLQSKTGTNKLKVQRTEILMQIQKSNTRNWQGRRLLIQNKSKYNISYNLNAVKSYLQHEHEPSDTETLLQSAFKRRFHLMSNVTPASPRLWLWRLTSSSGLGTFLSSLPTVYSPWRHDWTASLRLTGRHMSGACVCVHVCVCGAGNWVVCAERRLLDIWLLCGP